MASKGVIAGNTPRGEGMVTTPNGSKAYSILVNPLPQVITGPGAVNSIGATVLKYGKAAFIVSDPGVSKAGLVAQLRGHLEAAGLPVLVYDKVQPNPTFANVREGIEVMLSSGHALSDMVLVSLGGGSAMDCAKAISVIGADAGKGKGADVLSYCRNPELTADGMAMDPESLVPARLPEVPGLSIIAVPTTSGTASETNGGAVLTDSDAATPRKLIFSAGSAQAKVVLLDPELTLGLPAYPTATCGMDALTHALEAFTSLRQNPYSDSIAYGVICTVAEWLPVLMRDLRNLEARSRIQLASHMAGVAFGMAGLGICHAMGHPLSAVLHQAHGQTLATMLPHIMEFNQADPRIAKKYARVAEAFGVYDSHKSDLENAKAAIAAVADLSITVGTARSITQMGGSADMIPTLVDQAMKDTSMRHNIIQPSPDQLTAMFSKALNNSRLYPGKTMAAKL